MKLLEEDNIGKISRGLGFDGNVFQYNTKESIYERKKMKVEI